MADKDKIKRFRVHVVKELFETERDYTHELEFTVTHILQKAREIAEHGKTLAENDRSFTPEIIDTLFCNIEEILAFHKDLMTQLNRCVGAKGAAYDTQIARCYSSMREQFNLYQKYGECNELAQKLLYELYENPKFKAFFVACMLLGGKQDEDISGLVFKPIQRICKYPLLFRELGKYTPEGHPDYAATQDAQQMMRDVCSVINEAKRRVEKLEAIADWQATVDGWEGTNVIDTCNELVKEGPLIKISAGNTQERQFYLFDNLFVYCKKTTQLLSKGKGLLFRGRIPVGNLNIEDIADGTSDYYTSGIAVNNSWKVHNVAKNKWFVLVAKTAEEKVAWMEAIRREKEKRKRQAAALAQDNRALALDKGEKLYYLMRREKFMKDHKSRLRTHPNTFTGQEFVTWLVVKQEVADSSEGVLLGQALLENGVIHHISDRHQFKNDRDLLYRFRYDDGTFRSKLNSSDITARGIRLYCRLHGLFDPLIKEQKVGLRAMKCVINSQKMIDWWQSEKDIHSRQGGVDLGLELFATGFLRHATDEQNFKDGTFLYRFTADDGHEGPKDKEGQRRLTTVASKVDFNICSVSCCRTITLPYLKLDHGYGIEISDSHPFTVQTVSLEAQLHGVCEGQTVLAINGVYLTVQNQSDLLSQLMPTGTHAPPLTLLIFRPGSSEYATLVPTSSGLGFHIKGNSPVIIHGVDKGSSAAQAGIVPGCCILKVGEEDVLRSSHELVVSAVKSCLTRSKQEQGKASVKLKLSFPFLEQLACYKYERVDTSIVEVFERTVESPYTFSLPAQLLKLYADEANEVVAMVSGSGVTDEKVATYLDDLKAMAASYAKISIHIAIPRWPSYKLHGTANSAILEPCPTNLHTSILDVVTGATPSPPPTPTTPLSAQGTVPADQDNDAEPDSVTTSYLISTVAIPSHSGHSITASKADRDVLETAGVRRELVRAFNDRMADMSKDSDSIERMIAEVQGFSPPPDMDPPSNGVDFSELSLSPPKISALQDDITPSSSPVARRRHISISNPIPVLKLVVEGLLLKSEKLSQSLDDKLLLSVLAESDGILSPASKELVAQFKERLTSLSKEVKECAERPGEPLKETIAILLSTTSKYIRELCVRLWISLALVESVPLLETRDKLFSQCLTTVVTSFAHSLVKALKGQLNPGVEYETKNQEASTQWLQMVAKRGVLVHLQSTMLPKESSELAALKDLHFIQSQLSSVVLHVTEATSPQHLPCTELPPVTIKGSRDHLHVYYHLPRGLCDELPERFRSESGIRVIPLLFNKGLKDIDEVSAPYKEERALNQSSFKLLKDYYQGLRGFRLDKSNLPSDSDAKLVAVHQISQPLNAMDILVRQVEVAIKEPTRPGVGLLALAAEVTTRMGAVRINVCNSGVYRSVLATSLEQVMVLGRCHGLPFKSFRTTLNRIRRKGGFSYILRKNNAVIGKCLPSQPPKLYQLPPDTSEA